MFRSTDAQEKSHAIDIPERHPAHGCAREPLLAAGAASAANVTVYLQAQSATKALPDGVGGTVQVPTWVFVCDPGQNNNPYCFASASGSARINAAAGDNLTTHLTNTLNTPVSILIPGQVGGGNPVMVGSRVRSFTPEVAANSPTTATIYTWNAVRPGTYLYRSGTHAPIQVPMGLHGALVVAGPATPSAGSCSSGQPAYDNVNSCHNADALLHFSEIDPVQNQRVANAAGSNPTPLPLTTTCVKLADYAQNATRGYPCTVDYNPVYFLINGVAYDKTQASPPAALPAGAAGDRVLLRLLNAGLRSHVPAIVGLDMALIAEDGHLSPGLAKQQSEALLPAGKTLDAVVSMPNANATYALFDRMPASSQDALPAGGMLAALQVGSGSAPPPNATIRAVNDAYAVIEDTPLVALVGQGVLANDIGLAAAAVALVAGPSNGTLALNSNGSFTYTPNPNYSGPDGFTYKATLSGISYPAQVTLNVSFVNDAPAAAADGPYVNSIGSSIVVDAAHGVLGNDSDPDGDALTAVLVTPPASGTLSLLPNGSFTYTGGTPGSTVTFTYRARDSSLALSNPATVTLKINPVANIALTVKEPGLLGAVVTAYRWLVQEDATYPVNPAAPPALLNSLSLNFHKSHMPVVAQGCVGCTPANIPFNQLALDPTKRYYVSVLPNDAGTGTGHTIGGAQLLPGATAVTVIVNRQEIPTAQISVLVFEDNSPTNGVPDANEPRLGGFQIVLEDAGGRYGISGGTMSQDAFGNPLKNSLYGTAACPGEAPVGVILTCPDGSALIKDLAPGKYGVIAVAPAGTGPWTQTSTIEGTKVIDAWVKAGEPPFMLQFGGPGPHAFFGFVNPANLTGATGTRTITGRVTLLHDPRPPGLPGTSDSGSYAGLGHTRAWVGLNTIGGDGPNIATVRADPDGNFTLSGIPDGTHQIVVWDTYLDQVIAFQIVTVAGANVAVGNVPVNHWFTRAEHNVFLDDGCASTGGVGGIAGDGIRQDCEAPLPEQVVNLRWRDGTVNQTFPTDTEGFVPFDQVFPFFSWQVFEVDYTRFKPTGVTVTVDAGGAVDASGILNPQIQADGISTARTETGPVLTQAFQGFPGQTSIFHWGKRPYAPGENGGISGIVFYGSTRGEQDPRLTVGDPWEPGIPGVKVRLYREVARIDGSKALSLVQEVLTDSWDAATPTQCPGESATDPFTTQTLGVANLRRCYDGWRNWNQVRPGVFDGGYAFNDIPPGKYVVEVVPPPGYELIKEEDVNVGFGDSFGNGGPFATVPVILPNGMLVTIVPDPATVQAARAPEPGLAQPPCVGPYHTVPAELSLFPGMEAPFAGSDRPLCNRKQVVLSDQGQAAADFHLFTSTPIAAQFAGLITDDISTETDPRSPGFGEKWSPAFLPFSIRDFKGQEVYRGYGDAFGRYNGVLPSTFTANVPIPSGYSPAMAAVCLNDPGPIAGPIPGLSILDPLRLPSYGNYCYTMQFMPGTTTYLDTPVLPTAAFAAGYNPADCAAPVGTPLIASVDVQGGNFGPLVVPGATLVIRSMGQNVAVPNPAYEGPLAAAPYNQPTVNRDLGFGAQGPQGSTQGKVTLNGVPLTVTQWNANQIRATVPTGATTGQLVVTRSNGNVSVNAVTVTVSNQTPIRVAAGGSIQAAIDAAAPGALILVAPGTYNELVVMWKPVRLQGSGAATIINAVKRPTEKLQAWNEKVAGLISAGSVDLLPGQVDLATELGAGITVLARTTGCTSVLPLPAYCFNATPSRIDGFTISGADGGGGIYVNGYAHRLEISNNHVTGNSGNLHGGVRVGRPFLALGAGPYAFNTGVDIHHNAITLNGARHFESAGGGVSLSAGTDNYQVRHNFICGNFSSGDGAGIGHLGRSDNGRIEFNKILFNQSVNASLNQHGGGIVIAGVPAAPPALTLGTGNVSVDANLIKGNHAGSGHGGGIRTQLVNGTDVQASSNSNNWHRVTITNNMIVNNVAAWSGAGISLQDTVNASIVNNTIADNDSTATVGGLIVGNLSAPQPAGVSAERHSPLLAAALGTPNGYSNPTLVNNIVWRNRAFHYEGTQVPALRPALAPTSSVGQCATGAQYWDLGVLGEPLASPSVRLNPTYSILTNKAGYDATSNRDDLEGSPAFLSAYCNGARTLRTPWGPMLATAAFGEGGNFLDVRYGPLTQAWPAASAPWNYHIGAGSAGLNNGNATGAPNHDFDNQARPLGTGVDRGADEFMPPPGTLTLSATFTSPTGASLTATTLNFGNKTGAVSSTVTFTVGGGTAVTFGTAAVTNGTPAAFSKGADTCSNSTSQVGQTCTITVNFNGPATNSPRTGTLSVPHNGAGNPTTRILTGS